MISRREFNLGLGAALASTGTRATAAPYRGPNVIVIRYGGGVRRRETIDPAHSYSPYMLHDLAPRGVLIPDMVIDQLEGGNTSHAEGTLNILTGRYKAYRDAGSRFLTDRLEPVEPTLFEYLRDAYDIPSHQALLINGEDRPQEEFFTYGVHNHYGIDFRSEMLSLHRFKLYKVARQLEELGTDDPAHVDIEKQYQNLLAADPRDIAPKQSPDVTAFWRRWRLHYGDDGLRNPRGDRLLTELTIRAMEQLRPRLIMVNYQDPDYVHWGNASHYTRAIQVIDEGLQRIVRLADADDFYAGNTIFAIVPDCGRDANDLVSLPFQHHFNTRAAHEIFGLFFGPGITKGRVLDKQVDQTAVAPTLAALMGVQSPRTEGDILSELGA
ncbi:hypothetical protein [Aliiroseovarius subalbicans]|uniref:hypothetical protein n=1 Tax=Aliiroseovarius subalbicans TaxID=2925840 RepID=UPI001F56AF5A|nr:hypothetical protein [Aliiroseovarius subalbicans]MCI2398783.1 hypothetical protein [Aliiroseovarius subalbicans]